MRLSFGGALTQQPVFEKNLFKLKHLQQKGYQITVFDGPNLCKWNGGRANIEVYLTPELLEWYNNNNIGVNLTFTNNVVDINDPVGNQLLEMISFNELNGVIVQNMELYWHIKIHYPYMPITHSFTSPTYTTQEYLEIEDLFDYLVPKIDLFFNSDFYTQVDLPKYELWVDEQCIGCEKIVYHYNKIAEINREFDKPYEEKGHDFCKSWNDCILPDYNRCNNSGLAYFNKETFDKLREIGYSNFKIPGRDFEPERFDKIIKDVYGFLK